MGVPHRGPPPDESFSALSLPAAVVAVASIDPMQCVVGVLALHQRSTCAKSGLRDLAGRKSDPFGPSDGQQTTAMIGSVEVQSGRGRCFSVQAGPGAGWLSPSADYRLQVDSVVQL